MPPRREGVGRVGRSEATARSKYHWRSCCCDTAECGRHEYNARPRGDRASLGEKGDGELLGTRPKRALREGDTSSAVTLLQILFVGKHPQRCMGRVQVERRLRPPAIGRVLEDNGGRPSDDLVGRGQLFAVSLRHVGQIKRVLARAHNRETAVRGEALNGSVSTWRRWNKAAKLRQLRSAPQRIAARAVRTRTHVGFCANRRRRTRGGCPASRSRDRSL
eukprot:6197619-Pleurochrysis_carterae.AAC.3